MTKDTFHDFEQANYIPPSGKAQMVYHTGQVMERPESLPYYDTDEVYSLNWKMLEYDTLLKLHDIAMGTKSGARVDSQGKTTDDWLTHSIWTFEQCRESSVDFSYIMALKDHLELTEDDSIAFWVQQPWSKHRWHCDSVKCSLNILLGDDTWTAYSYGPIQYRREDGTFSTGYHDPTDKDQYVNYFYQCALINSTHSHRAYAEGDIRKMFRFSIRSKSFEQMKDFLKELYHERV
tara:strand:+ start:19913 stop:20614 length:702 start_codon:yes stop_codon:yes gene_type:complete